MVVGGLFEIFKEGGVGVVVRVMRGERKRWGRHYCLRSMNPTLFWCVHKLKAYALTISGGQVAADLCMWEWSYVVGGL